MYFCCKLSSRRLPAIICFRLTHSMPNTSAIHSTTGDILASMQASKKKSRRCCTSIGLFMSTLGRSPKYLAAIMPMTFLSSSPLILDCKSPVFIILDLVIANSCCSFTFLLTCERIDFRLLSICCFFFSRSFSRFAAASSFAFCARFSRFFFSASVSGGLPRPRFGGVAMYQTSFGGSGRYAQ